MSTVEHTRLTWLPRLLICYAALAGTLQSSLYATAPGASAVGATWLTPATERNVGGWCGGEGRFCAETVRDRCSGGVRDRIGPMGRANGRDSRRQRPF